MVAFYLSAAACFMAYPVVMFFIWEMLLAGTLKPHEVRMMYFGTFMVVSGIISEILVWSFITVPHLFGFY